MKISFLTFDIGNFAVAIELIGGTTPDYLSGKKCFGKTDVLSEFVDGSEQNEFKWIFDGSELEVKIGDVHFTKNINEGNINKIVIWLINEIGKW